MRFWGRALLRGKRFEEDPSQGLGRGKEAVGSVPSPCSRRPPSSSLGWGLEGTQPALRVQARREETWPKESDSGTFRNSRRPGAFGQPSIPARLPVPGGRGSSLGGAAGPLGRGSETQVWKSQARGWLSAGPPIPPQGPLFLIKFKLRLLGWLPTPLPLPLFRTTSPLHSSFVSFPPLILHPPLHPSFLQAGA